MPHIRSNSESHRDRQKPSTLSGRKSRDYNVFLDLESVGLDYERARDRLRLARQRLDDSAIKVSDLADAMKDEIQVVRPPSMTPRRGGASR